MRLVNADTVVDYLKDLIKSGMYPTIIAEKFVPLVHAIQMLPRVDAEPIVRCEKCQWYDGRLCRNWDKFMPKDFWCKDGEESGNEAD